MRRVLLEVVERGGFGTPAPEGRARGLAMHHTFGSYCAHVVEVSVAPGSNGQKRVTIHKVVSVADVGQPVNLSMLEAQMQGGIIDGIGAAFYGEVPIAERPSDVAELRRLPPDPHARSAARDRSALHPEPPAARPASASRRCRRSRRRSRMRSPR